MQIFLSQKETADANSQQRMPKPLTYRSTCNLDNLRRASLKLLLPPSTKPQLYVTELFLFPLPPALAFVWAHVPIS